LSEQFFALAIAGGRGERLRPLTDSVPKPMVPVSGRPMISYQVDWMRSQGVTDVVFLCGYLGETIRDYFGNGSKHGINAHYSFEDTPLGRGGAVRKGLSLVPQDAGTVLVTNGDNITDQPLSEMKALHELKNALATIMLAPYYSQYGTVEADDDGTVTGFVEKGRLPLWINAGVYLFDRSLEQRLPKVGDHETTTFQELAAERKMAALRSEAMWLTVDSQKDLREVEERLKARYG
jgi:NDP-sugar pyrophosphorylase family protein